MRSSLSAQRIRGDGDATSVIANVPDSFGSDLEPGLCAVAQLQRMQKGPLPTWLVRLAGALAVVAAAACDSDDSTSGGSGGSAGAAATGGAGSGGDPATGGAGSGGIANTGGDQPAGGTTVTGGTGSGGEANAGGAGSGGEANAGGSPASGGSSAAGGSPATGGTASVWRPYSDSSPWNTPIGNDPALDPNSDALIADFESSSAYGEHLDVNIPGFSIPLYWADADTPRVTITCRVGGHGFVGTNGMDATAEIPMPVDAAPDPESDHHLLIIDRSTNTEYGLWDAQYVGGEWTCGLGAMQDLNGDGVRPLAEVADPWWEAHGPRACGFGLSAGLIRPEELAAGVIEHALVVAYPHIRSGWYVSPASTAQASNGVGAEPDRGVPCGGRIQYDPAIDVDSLDVSEAGKAILRALQIYGAYVGDYSGAISLYADNSPEARAYYDSIGFGSYELLDRIDLADFRVIEIGQMYDNGNG
jgi:hypothetical protein